MVGIDGVDHGEQRIEGVALQPVGEHIGAVVAGDPGKANQFLGFGFFDSTDGAVFGEGRAVSRSGSEARCICHRSM